VFGIFHLCLEASAVIRGLRSRVGLTVNFLGVIGALRLLRKFKLKAGLPVTTTSFVVLRRFYDFVLSTFAFLDFRHRVGRPDLRYPVGTCPADEGPLIDVISFLGSIITQATVRPAVLIASVVAFCVCTPCVAFAQQPVRQFRASGTHACQSSSDIGHMCTAFGVGYTDCNQAAVALQRQDCCPGTRRNVEGKPRLGGTSIGFSMNSCTMF
jgi:hypothetical protein